ncbi:MAG: NADH-quinone oxidoreductase subunit N [Phycisphaerales bacterium]
MLTLAAMPMLQKVQSLWPEIVLFAGACVVMVLGLSPQYAVRKLCGVVAFIAMAAAGVLAYRTTPAADHALPNLPLYGKVIAAGVGTLILLLLSGTADREYESAVARGEPFNAIRSTRGEFYAFFLFSFMGIMLCAGADDLIWLFLALELTSLPTYIMVAISTGRNRSMEAGVKYFFLGALGAALFLYGFTMLYGGTGSTNLASITQTLANQAAGGVDGPGKINAIAMAGLLLSVIGLCFKVAAVPMHFYTADVYQGASASVAAMLAFVPKAAGFFAILLICSTAGWTFAGQLPSPLHEVLWVLAALTMTVGNILAPLQTSVKRLLAYSSIAHSGYMLVGVLAGPGDAAGGFASSGIAAVLFYMLSYGIMTLGSFAVLACLERTGPDGKPEEIDSFDDLRGLCRSRPVLGYTLVLSALGLLGLPPTLGFFAKLPLFTSLWYAGQGTLLVILAVNSAIAAFYYLRLAGVAWLETAASPGPTDGVRVAPFAFRVIAGVLSAAGVIVFAVVPLTGAARHAAAYRPANATVPNAEQPPAAAEAAQPAETGAASTVSAVAR